MYPRISDLTLDLFGFEFPIPLYSFGLMVALGILVAAAMTRVELDRMFGLGIVKPVRVPVDGDKKSGRMEKASPSALVTPMMILAGVFGVAGSKLFHIIDYWDLFVENPMRMIFSASGLTFYGGLICASIAILVYAGKKGIDRLRLADAIAPGLILAYGIGRIGCYLSGDGDWGVCSTLADKPSWVPGFLWSETFPRNIIGADGVPVDPVAFNARVRGEECLVPDPTGVYPTMLYEFVLCALIAAGLWMLRKHPFHGGFLISLYAVFQGIERFLIEGIRTNPEVVFGLSQSQLISVALVVFGTAGAVWCVVNRPGTPDGLTVAPVAPDAPPAAAAASA